MRSFVRRFPQPLPRATALGAAMLALGLSAAQAESTVATSIPPVHSLVAKVMTGVGEPALIVPPGASPHHYSLRPSEAQALDEAEVVFWVGEALEPFLERPLETLAQDAHVVALDEADGTTVLPTREGGAWDPHDHDDDHDHGDEDAHDADHDHDHDEEHDHAPDEDHDHEHEAAHHHDGMDPHLWLDPRNAQAWVRVIADTLAQDDPDNAETYRANAERALADLKALETELRDVLTPVKTRPYIVFHDAYQYFEGRFGLSAVGSVTLSDARTPTPARLQEVRAKIADSGAACVFAEPQFEPKVVDTIVDGTEARKGVLDPLGATIPTGPGQYDALLRSLADALVDCLNP